MKFIITEAQYKKLFQEEAKTVQKKSDFKSVGKGGVNEPEDVQHIIKLFSDEKIGLADEITKVLEICNSSGETIDYAAIGKCPEFQKFIADYQKTQVFTSGFSDSRIDPGRDTITNLYNKIIGVQLIKSTYNSGWKGSGDFNSLANLVITRLEGGYYHPQMLTMGIVKDSRYASSGETMFGLDRKNGGTMNTGSEGQAFWNYIDENSGYSAQSAEKPKWKWGYMANDNTELKSLMISIVKKFFDSYMGQPYVSNETKKAVLGDKRLMLHLIYAVWNGPKWFQRFVGDINQYILTNPGYSSDDLANVALTSRLNSGNSLIVQGGNKIKSLFSNIS